MQDGRLAAPSGKHRASVGAYRMGRGRVEYVVVAEDVDFDVEARIDGVVVGRAHCIRDGDQILLADLHVDSDLQRAWPLFPWLLRWILGTRRPLQLRRKGIGSELLRRVLHEADSAGVRETWGSVMPADLQRHPSLLDWYERRGFVVEEPDAKCMRGAANMIVRRR